MCASNPAHPLAVAEPCSVCANLPTALDPWYVHVCTATAFPICKRFGPFVTHYDAINAAATFRRYASSLHTVEISQ